MVLAHPTSPHPALTYLKKAAFVARASLHPVHKMGAVVVKNGNTLGIGWNKNKTHPRSKNREYPTIHAELAALIRAGFAQEADMYVVRVTKGGSMGTSKPCRFCFELLREAKVKSVTFIDEKGEIVCTKP